MKEKIRKMKRIIGYTESEKRFLLFMPEYVMGGAETQFRYLIDFAERIGWKLDVIIEHRFYRKDNLLETDAARMKNVKFYELDGCGNEQERIIQQTIHHILKNILKVKYSACLIQYVPDIVLAPILRSFGIRVIYSERVDAANIIRDQYLIRCLRYCNRILTNSHHAKVELERVTGRKVGLIRNGKPVVQQLSKKENRDIQMALVPARIVSHKNQMLLLRYLKEYPNFTGKIVFAGVVEEKEYQRKLTRFINKNHLENRMEFLGYIDNMQEEYERADIVILPSLAEGTPNVVLEAYAYGRPVIVSDIMAEREIVTDPHLRFKTNDPEDVDKCIRYIQNLSEESYDKMIEKNREFVLKNYNIERMVRQFHKVLTEG